MSLISFPAEAAPSADIFIHIDDCRNVLKFQQTAGVQYDAIISDPPYELNLHGKAWDATGISFSPELWHLLYAVLKPGGYLAAFSSARLYHRMAIAAEDAGFALYPFMAWHYPNGLPKPANVSELFDRDSTAVRPIIGYRAGSGFTTANVVHGAQNRTSTQFPIRARYLSPESQRWRGWYYGVNCLRPAIEPILLAQKPVEGRTIDNLRQHGTGALNLGALTARYGRWPSTILDHAKAKKASHGSNHPSVKPTGLLEDLCLLLCPPGGHILDPFAGTGSTALAARCHGFHCTLIEINPDMRAVMHRRLNLPDQPVA